MNTITLEEMKRQFAQYDTKKVWNKKEIKDLYNYILEVDGFVTEDNFNVWYCIDNKESVNF